GATGVLIFSAGFRRSQHSLEGALEAEDEGTPQRETGQGARYEIFTWQFLVSDTSTTLRPLLKGPIILRYFLNGDWVISSAEVVQVETVFGSPDQPKAKFWFVVKYDDAGGNLVTQGEYHLTDNVSGHLQNPIAQGNDANVLRKLST